MVVNLDYVLFQNSGFLGYTRNNSECLIFQYVLSPPFAWTFGWAKGTTVQIYVYFSVFVHLTIKRC